MKKQKNKKEQVIEEVKQEIEIDVNFSVQNFWNTSTEYIILDNGEKVPITFIKEPEPENEQELLNNISWLTPVNVILKDIFCPCCRKQNYKVVETKQLNKRLTIYKLQCLNYGGLLFGRTIKTNN